MAILKVSGLTGTVLDRIPGRGREEWKYLSADSVSTADTSTDNNLTILGKCRRTLSNIGWAHRSCFCATWILKKVVAWILSDRVPQSRLIMGSRARAHTFIPRIALGLCR